MSARDPELTRILVLELERHLAALERAGADLPGDASRDAARRSVHALKGSAGLAGEPELAAAMLALEGRLRGGDAGALGDAADVVRESIARLSAGERATSFAWPVPSPAVRPGTVDPLVRVQYTAELADRLARIDEALTSGDLSSADAAREIYRHVHTMKGAASVAGDEPMAWFCHGLEERLRVITTGAPNAAAIVLEEVAGWRAILGTLLDDPEGALAILRGLPARARPGSVRPTLRGDDEARRDADGTVRVSTQSVDRLLDHASRVAAVRERLSSRVGGAMQRAGQLRRARAELVEALRQIGPPRPWGAPAAAIRRIERASLTLATTSTELEAAAEYFKIGDLALKENAAAARRIVATMRHTPIRAMFARLEAAVQAEARRAGREVSVRTVGADEPVDRRLLEALTEPCMQLARNAIAHGIEPPSEREALGKPRAATLTLTARRSASRLSVALADDGGGVDVAAVRSRAVETGVVTEVLAEAADDQTLLELLFLPGFSTRTHSPDLLAGRGVGLDITLAAVQRLGGTIRLSARAGQGFEARIDLPIESGLATVLWVFADGCELAVPAMNARRVRRAEDQGEAERVLHLRACLEPRSLAAAPLVLDLDGGELGDAEGATFSVGIDAVGTTEEVLVRRLSPLLWGIGPYAGAVVRGDGSIRLALDVHALAPRVRALGRVPESRASERPSRLARERPT